MPATMPAPQVLEREFLEIRAKILDLAASLDRLDRGTTDGAGDVSADPRMRRVLDGLRLLLSDSPDRAERLQLLFSREYDASWRKAFGL